MEIDLDHIKYFQALRDEGSLSGAAEKVGRAKSAVSYAIDRLQEQLDFPLVEHGGYRLVLTPQGQAFLHKAQSLLEAEKDLKSFAKQISQGVEMKLSISCSEIFPLKEFNQLLIKVKEAFPDTELTIHRELLSGEKMLENDQVDIAIFESLKRPHNYEHKFVQQEKLLLSIASQHPFHQIPKDQQAVEKLFLYPQIVQKSTIANEVSFGVFKDSRHWTVSDTQTKKQMIIDGLGWGRLPETEISDDIHAGRLVHLPHLSQDDEVSFFLSRKRGRQHGKVSDFIWENFGKICQ